MMSLQLCLGIPGGCQPVNLSALEKGQRGALLVYNSDSSDGTGTTGSQFGKKVFFQYPSVVDNGGTKSKLASSGTNQFSLDSAGSTGTNQIKLVPHDSNQFPMVQVPQSSLQRVSKFD
ncbi:hypothetical protein TURU_123402 [Turdus rufiventris]|nr:hypothetical protein TURU_123402 [Turdus rufiventris]